MLIICTRLKKKLLYCVLKLYNLIIGTQLCDFLTKIEKKKDFKDVLIIIFGDF